MSIHLQNQINELKAQVAALCARIDALVACQPSLPIDIKRSALLELNAHDKAAREILNTKRQRIADDTD